MSEKKGFLKNLASLGIIQIANFVMPLISVPIISRIIGPEHFGIIQYANAFVIYFNIFIGYGFSLTATRKLAQNPFDKELRSKIFSEVFYCQLLLFCVSCISLMILTFTVPALINDKKVALFSFLFCISSVLTQNWIFQAMQDLSKVTVLNLLGKVVYLIMVLSFVTTKELYYWQPLSLSITQIIISIFSFIWAKKKYQIKLVHIKLKSCLTILWEERTVFLSLVFTSMYTTANIVILGLLYENSSVGYYTAAQRLVAVCLQVLTLPLAQVLYPFIGKAFSKGNENGVAVAQKFMPITMLVSFCLSLSIFFLAEPVLFLFYGDKFANSVIVFKILAFIPFLSSLNNMIGIQFMLNLKMDKQYFKVMASCSLFSIVFNFIITYYFGYRGTAVAWVLTECVIFSFLCLHMKNSQIKVFNPDLFTFNHFKNMAGIVVSKKQIVNKKSN